MRFTKSDLERLAHVKDLILSDLSRHIKMPELAREAGINERKLHEGFKRMYHQTIYSFLKDERMKLAKRLLKETDIPVTVIAAQVGYSRQENFTHAFKSYMGTTPLMFRKSID